MRAFKILSFIFSLSVLSACGQKGPLTLPEPEQENTPQQQEQ